MHITNVTRRPSLQKEDTLQIRFSPPDAPHSTVNSPLLFFLLLISIISLLLNYEMTKCLDTEVKKRLAVAAPILKAELYGLPAWLVSYTFYLVQIVVHSHFHLVSLLLSQFATGSVAQMATQMIVIVYQFRCQFAL